MTYWRILWLLLLLGMQTPRGPRGTSAAETPCPDVFQYEGSPGNEHGIITVPNPYPYLAIDITVEIYITAPVPSGGSRLYLVDKNAWEKLAAGARGPVLYRLDFPLPSPLPTIKSITVNQEVICRGNMPSAPFLTTITLQHAVFNQKCFSSSLECPYNIQQSPQINLPNLPSLPPQKEDTAFYVPEYEALPSSPCPDVFQYERDRSGEWHGIIRVPNPYPVVAIGIKVELYLTTITQSNRRGQLGLVNNLKEEWERMRTGEQYFIPYRLDFPVRSPLPTIKSITVNNQVICRGNKPSSLTLTTLSFQHSLYNQECTSSSLDCPYNIEQNEQPDRPIQPTNKPASSEKPPSPPTHKPETPKEEPDEIISTPCGSPEVRTNPLIFNGQDTTRGQWPWQAALYKLKGYDTLYICGGSFVGTKTVITAAHCVTEGGRALSPSDFIVYLGRHNLRNRKEEGVQERDVSSIYIHPSFNITNVQADVAMLVLAGTVQYTLNVRPVCLWSETDTNLDSIVGKEGVVVGWGLDENGNTAEKLKMVKMPVVKQEICLWSHATFFSRFTSNTTFCAGFRNGSSVCNGDSGSGMVFPQNQRSGTQIWKLRGIVSSSKPNDNDNKLCDPNNYIIFTDIAQYLDWINSLLI